MLQADLKRAKIKTVVDFHSLKTLFINRLIEAKYMPYTVQQLAAHKDLATTMKYYAQLNPASVGDAIKELAPNVVPLAYHDWCQFVSNGGTTVSTRKARKSLENTAKSVKK
jgi:hypothetical protein